MLPLISFETGRKTQTQSSGQQKSAAPANGSLVLSRNHGREANTRGEEIKKNLHPRSSGACRESFCPLDKDLSWKSRNRKLESTWTVSAFTRRWPSVCVLSTLALCWPCNAWKGTNKWI